MDVVNKNLIDVSQVFSTYITFGGDAARTAVACNLDKSEIEALATAENWPAKVAEWTKIREGDPRDAQIQINRAINFVQATRARALLDKVITHLSKGTADELVDRLTVMTKNGPEFKTRALTDLVKAMESCQLMTARALGDTVAERPEDEKRKGSDIALNVIEALNAAAEVGLNSEEVVRKQLEPPPKLKQ